MITDEVTAPLSVDGLFVPPDGALQFEFYPEFAVLEGIPFTWVIPVTGNRCPNGNQGYEDVRDPGGELLCGCNGRVIE